MVPVEEFFKPTIQNLWQTMLFLRVIYHLSHMSKPKIKTSLKLYEIKLLAYKILAYGNNNWDAMACLLLGTKNPRKCLKQ